MSAMGDEMGAQTLSDNIQVSTLAAVHQVQARMDGMRTKVEGVETQVKNVDVRVSQQAGALQAIQKSVDDLTKDSKEMRGWLEGTTSVDGERKEGALTRSANADKRLGVQNYILSAILIAVIAEVVTRYIFPITTTIHH